MSRQITLGECTPVGTYGLGCPGGWNSEGYTPPGSCYTPYGPGWRRICARYNYDPNVYGSGGYNTGFEAASIAECCANWDDLTDQEKENCKRRSLVPYGMRCDKLMQQSCSQTGSVDCDKYVTNAPRGSWFYNYPAYNRAYPTDWLRYGNAPVYNLPRDSDTSFIYRDPVPNRYYPRGSSYYPVPDSMWQPIVNIPRGNYNY